jgi:hypothetical protein
MAPTQHPEAPDHRHNAQQVAHFFQPPPSPRPSMVVVQVAKAIAIIERQLKLAGPREEGQVEIFEQRSNQLVVLVQTVVVGEVVVDTVELPGKDGIESCM